MWINDEPLPSYSGWHSNDAPPQDLREQLRERREIETLVRGSRVCDVLLASRYDGAE